MVDEWPWSRGLWGARRRSPRLALIPRRRVDRSTSWPDWTLRQVVIDQPVGLQELKIRVWFPGIPVPDSREIGWFFIPGNQTTFPGIPGNMCVMIFDDFNKKIWLKQAKNSTFWLFDRRLSEFLLWSYVFDFLDILNLMRKISQTRKNWNFESLSPYPNKS